MPLSMLAVMGYPGRCWISVSISHAKGNDKRTLPQSDQIREVAWSMEETTKQVANI